MVRLTDGLGMTIAVHWDANLYKASILLEGHQQMGSDQVLHCLLN